MNKEDYIITICFDKTGEAYWNVTKKGEPHMCNVEELKMVSSTFNLLRMRIDFITEEQWTDHGDNYYKMNCEGYKQTGKCFVDGRCKDYLDNLKNEKDKHQ